MNDSPNQRIFCHIKIFESIRTLYLLFPYILRARVERKKFYLIYIIYPEKTIKNTFKIFFRTCRKHGNRRV